MKSDEHSRANKKDKAQRLVEYLTDLVRINSKIIRSLEEYRKVLWIYDIPQEPKYCYSRAWDQRNESGNDIWIEIKKFPEPRLPDIPKVCRDWVNYETVRIIDDLPLLYEAITVARESQDSITNERFTVNETLYLKDYSEIQRIWDNYLEKNWLPWAELYKRYEAVQNVYAELFRIYQEQQKLGEQLELIYCVGLLTWRTLSGHDIKRHLIVAKASLEFEPHLGKFTVVPSSDIDQVAIELDMLDLEDQPENARKLIEDGRTALHDNFWDRSEIDRLLESIANSLADSGQGEYYKDRLEPQHDPPSNKPTIEYAPALILRKRSLRGLEYLLAKMKEQIEAGAEIPDEFLDLCENLDENADVRQVDDAEEERPSGETEIYFPLPANDEQREIIKTLDRQKGVLVQGPPGTGKSHTIANLICHLLATGQRVLITAKTPRALQVLYDKLPDEIKPLCVNLLGSGTEERKSLEKSVAGILMRHDSWNETNSSWRIKQLETQIQTNRKARAEVTGKLMALRESETFRHIVADGAYNGRAAEIARRLKDEDASYAWFSDRIAPEMALPLSQEEIQSLCRDIVKFDAEAEKQLNLFIPNPDSDLPRHDFVRALFEKEKDRQQRVAECAEHIQSQNMRAFLHYEKTQIQQLNQCLEELMVARENVLKRPMVWVLEAVNDVLTGKDTQWKELLRMTAKYIEKLHEAAMRVDMLKVDIKDGLDRKRLLYDAEVLKCHFNAGGARGFWFFKPKAIREHEGLLSQVMIDGHDCNDIDTLEKLIDYLTIEQRLDYIWTLWSGKTDRHYGAFPLQIAEIEELCKTLESILALYDHREKVTTQPRKLVL